MILCSSSCSFILERSFLICFFCILSIFCIKQICFFLFFYSSFALSYSNAFCFSICSNLFFIDCNWYDFSLIFSIGIYFNPFFSLYFIYFSFSYWHLLIVEISSTISFLDVMIFLVNLLIVSLILFQADSSFKSLFFPPPFLDFVYSSSKFFFSSTRETVSSIPNTSSSCFYYASRFMILCNSICC